MDIDKKTIKVLSSDTRVDILKSLTQRRKMPSELSKEFEMAASTIVEHLKQLESAGLVERKATGRKWIYYELTRQGRNLVKPQFPVQFNVLLTLGVIFMFTGVLFFAGALMPATFMPKSVTVDSSELNAPGASIGISQAPSVSYSPLITMFTDWLWLIVFLIGLVMLIIALVIKYDLPLRR